MRGDKEFPRHEDRREFLRDPDFDRRLAAALAGSEISVAEAVRELEVAPRLVGRLVNGYGDPACVAILLAALVESHGLSYIRAPELVRWLNHHRPMYRWDAVTVGRVLGTVYEFAGGAYGDQNPFGRGRDYISSYYVFLTEEARPYLLKLFLGMAAEARRSQNIQIHAKPYLPWHQVDTSRFSPELIHD